MLRNQLPTSEVIYVHQHLHVQLPYISRKCKAGYSKIEKGISIL